MNDKSQVKSNDEFTVCPDCGGLRGNFAGTPCKCIPGDSTLELAGKERLTRPEDALISTLQSQLTQANSGWRTMQEKCERLENQFAEITTQLTQAHKERDEMSAAGAVMRGALDHLLVHAIEFYRDWNKGDFALSKLAQCDMKIMFDQFDAATKALSTNCGKAFLERIKEAGRLLEKNNSQHGESAQWRGGEPLNRAAMMIAENDAWLTPPTDTQKGECL